MESLGEMVPTNRRAKGASVFVGQGFANESKSLRGKTLAACQLCDHIWKAVSR